MLAGLDLVLRRPISRLVGYVTRSQRAAEWIFGIRLLPLPDRSLYYFDVTTPVLLREASTRATRDTRVADLGTGPWAILGVALWKRHGCTVVSGDVDRTLLEMARANARANEAPIQVVESRFLDNVAGDVGLVTFNPPYVQRAHGTARGLATAHRVQWDGGEDGLDVIRAFLDAVERDSRRPLVLMGVNRWHVPTSRLARLISSRSALQLMEVVEDRWLPVAVYVFRKTDARSPLTRERPAPA